MPITTTSTSDSVNRRKRGGRGQFVLSLIFVTLVCALGVGIYFLVDHLRWVGLLLFGHSVLSLAVILTSLARRNSPDLKALTFA